jgi:hypothetical protein
MYEERIKELEKMLYLTLKSKAALNDLCEKLTPSERLGGA